MGLANDAGTGSRGGTVIGSASSALSPSDSEPLGSSPAASKLLQLNGILNAAIRKLGGVDVFVDAGYRIESGRVIEEVAK